MPAVTTAELSDLLLILYESVRSRDAMAEFLTAIAKLCRADGAAMVQYDFKTGRPLAAHIGYDESAYLHYEAYFAAINPWMPKPTDRVALPQGNVANSDEVLPLRQLERTEFYTDWGKPNNVVHSIAANLNLSDRDFLYLALNNGHSRGAHPETTTHLLSLLIPHLRNFHQAQVDFQGLAAFAGVLDSLTVPAFLLDSDGRIWEASRLARHLAERRDGIEIQRGILHAPGHSVQREIYRFMRQPLPVSSLFRIPRPAEREFHALLLRPDVANLPLLRSRVILVLIDPNAQSRDGIELASRFFGLTPAETAFVKILVETGSLDRTIQARGITRNTARTQMAAIFRKTSTDRQGQVIKLFSILGRIARMGDDGAGSSEED